MAAALTVEVGGGEPYIEPVDGVVQPPVVRTTERQTPLGPEAIHQLNYMKTVVNSLIKHGQASPFRVPVDAVKLHLPSYHTVIKRPMDLGTVRMRLENNYYNSLEECIRDLDLMFLNCFTFNPSTNPVYKKGMNLQKRYLDLVAKMPMWDGADPGTTGSEDTPGTSKKSRRRVTVPRKLSGSGTVELTGALKSCDAVLKEMFLKKHKDFAEPFYVPVSEKYAPGYHSVIKNPMDMGKMKKKLHSGEYSTPEEFAADMDLIVSNCLVFNPANSVYVEMAGKLQDLFEQKFEELVRQPESATGPQEGTSNVDILRHHPRDITRGDLDERSTIECSSDQDLEQPAQEEDSENEPWSYKKRKVLFKKIVKMMNHEKATGSMRAGLAQLIADAEPATKQKVSEQLGGDPAEKEVELDLEDCEPSTLDEVELYIQWCFSELTSVDKGLPVEKEQETRVVEDFLEVELVTDSSNTETASQYFTKDPSCELPVLSTGSPSASDHVSDTSTSDSSSEQSGSQSSIRDLSTSAMPQLADEPMDYE